jgi:hypothetical protein
MTPTIWYFSPLAERVSAGRSRFLQTHVAKMRCLELLCVVCQVSLFGQKEAAQERFRTEQWEKI